MKFSHLYTNICELCPSRLVLYKIRAKLKPSTLKISPKRQANFDYKKIMKFSHLHVHELCHSRLVLCSTRVVLKALNLQNFTRSAYGF